MDQKNRLITTKPADLHNRAMTLPMFYNIPPLEGSSRGHVATLPAASLASAIQNTKYLIRINLNASVKYTEVTDLWFVFANASKISLQWLMLDYYSLHNYFSCTWSFSSCTLVFLFSLSKQKAR